jgi:hypothetical protein
MTTTSTASWGAPVADITCPIPRVPAYADVQAAIKQARKEFPDLPGVSGHRREAARTLGVDYKTFMDVLTKRIPSGIAPPVRVEPLQSVARQVAKKTAEKTVQPNGIDAELRARLDRISTQFKDAVLRKDVMKALDESAAQTPRAAMRLNQVKEMTRAEQLTFGNTDTLAGYIDQNHTLMFHKGIRGPKAEVKFQKDLKTNWLSKCDHDHGSVDSTVAHEYGHHLDNTIRELGPDKARAMWDGIADALDLPRPAFIDERGLEKWGLRHSDVIKAKVSRYGATHPSEMLAESWAEYMGGAPRPHNVKIGNLLKELLGDAPKTRVAKVVDQVVAELDSPAMRSALSNSDQARKALEKARFRRGNLDKSKGWTTEAMDALTKYTEGNVVAMNTLKRDPAEFFRVYAKPLPRNPSVAAKINFSLQQQLIKDVELLEDLISKNALDRDVTVLRGLSHDMSHLDVGDFFADPAFLSTTTDLKIAEDFATGRGGRVVGRGGRKYPGWTVVMKAKKGTHAVAGADYQSEIVFGPGLKQRITSIDRIKRIIYSEVV